METPCKCCPICGALPGHQNPPTEEVWQHQHSPVREPFSDIQFRLTPMWWTPEGIV